MVTYGSGLKTSLNSAISLVKVPVCRPRGCVYDRSGLEASGAFKARVPVSSGSTAATGKTMRSECWLGDLLVHVCEAACGGNIQGGLLGGLGV